MSAVNIFLPKIKQFCSLNKVNHRQTYQGLCLNYLLICVT